MLQTVVFAQSGPPWVKTTLPYNYILRGIDFPSNQNNIGYISGESLTYNGNGIVLKTTDGGNTWNSVWTGNNEGCEGSCFVDVNTGFIAGWPKLSNGWSGFGKTTDGGVTWTSPSVATDVYYFNDVVFKDANNGILLGSTNTNARVWVTSNAGTTWSIATGLAGVPYHGCHVSGNTYFLADNAGHIQKSVNNGLTWTTVFSQPGALLTGIKFFNNAIGMATGDNGVIVKTYDGGVTWALQLIGNDIWHDAGWETQEHLYICGTPEIVSESSDGGTTWGNGFPASGHQAALYECIFTAGGWGYICGSQGTLLKRDPSCIAAFAASDTAICAGNTVTYTSQSFGNNLTYSWSFPGGTPSSSTLQNPVVQYMTAGVYNVNLTVNNGYWSSSIQKTNYIHVSVPLPAPVITSIGYTLSSNYTTGNQWFKDGFMIAGATSQNYLAQHSGLYWDVETQNGCSTDTSNNIYLLMTQIQGHSAPEINLSPIPCDGTFRLAVSGINGNRMSVRVCNEFGNCVFDKMIEVENGSATMNIDLRSQANGVYLVEIENNGERIVRKQLFYK